MHERKLTLHDLPAGCRALASCIGMEAFLEVARQFGGETVYIPNLCQLRNSARNRDIRARFAIGETIDQLAERYHLSCESIKRIVYCRKESIQMEYQGTLSSAQEWSRQGMLEEWVHAYLLSDGHNEPFSDGLKMVDRMFLGPVKMPLALFHRCTGPVEEGLKFQVHPVAWESHVRQLMEVIPHEPDIPPLIVHYLIPEGKTEGEFELNDGNTRWEAYTRLGIKEAHVIIWITDRYEYDQFMERYGEYVK